MENRANPFQRVRFGLACLASFLMAAVHVMPAEAEVLYVVSNGTLYGFDVDSGEAGSIGPTHADGVLVFDMALAPDGQLYGIGTSAGIPGLYVFDTLTGLATAIGPLVGLGSSEMATALAFDGSGQLWLAAGTTLYRVETATAAATPMADLGRGVEALAALGGELYTLTVDPLLGTNHLGVIDPDILALRNRFDLPDVREFIWDATFDSRGRLRILAQGASLLSDVALLFYEVDIVTGGVEESHREIYHFTEALAGIRNLAGPVPAPAAIPTLGSGTLALFAALLLAAALARFRRGAWPGR